VTAVFENFPLVIEPELNLAKKKLVIAVAWITFQRYSRTFKSVAMRGVSVRIYCADHPTNRKQTKEINGLRKSGVEVILYKMPRKTNFMHHKFAIIDESTVLTGSFNWSDNALKSFENLLVIKEEPAVIQAFLGEVSKLVALNEAAIRSLQSLKRCQRPGCPGSIVHILVIHPDAHPTSYEHWGDVVATCSVCAEEQQPDVIEQGVQVSQLYSHLTSCEHIDTEGDTEAQRTRFDRLLDEYLTIEGNRSRTLHAIGIVDKQVSLEEEDAPSTRILWKNKFVDEYLRDEYETTFGL
jgi:hypothetical protein